MSVINGNSSELIVKNGLILNLDAGNRKSYVSGSNTWFDLSGNNNSGSLVNGPTFDSGNGGSIVFDGSNDYAVVYSAPTLNMGNKSFTGEVWIKIANFNSGERMIFEYNVWGNPGTYQLTTFGNTIRINFPEAYPSKYLDYSYTPLTTNVWMQIVGQFDTDNNNYNLYINGVAVSQVTGATQEIGNITSTMYIMSRGGSGLYLPGNLGIFRMYNRALSASEVLQNYNANKSRFASSSLSISNVPKVPTNGLILSLDAANVKSYVSGSTNIYDISPTNLSGSLINGVGYSSAKKGSLTFDGSNDYVEVSDNPVFNFGGSDFTINIILKVSKNDVVIYGQTSGGGYAPVLLLFNTTWTAFSYWASSTPGFWNILSTDLQTSGSLDTWTDLTLTRKGNVWTSYKDGQYANSKTSSGTLYDSSDSMKIGGRLNFNNYMSGSISSVRIYNRALSASEVRSMYDATKGRYGL